MIRLSNGHALDHVVSSGSLAFDGRGWPWQRAMVASGLIRPDLFTVVLKTLTRAPREGNLKLYRPWTSVRLVPGGSVNKVGLTNPGFDWWLREVAPRLDYARVKIAVSLFGDAGELAEMAAALDRFPLAALEVNPSCPNTGHALGGAAEVVEGLRAAKRASRHPLIVKVSTSQDYRAIARGAKGLAEAVSLNSVPWEAAFPDRQSPLWRLERRVGGGGGGVSGRPAQALNWRAVREIAADGALPVIAPSVMGFDDLERVRALGARAVGYGAIHFRAPWLPTRIARRDLARRGAVAGAEVMEPRVTA